MKKQWDQFPFVLRRKILLTALAGLASLAVSLVIFTATTDHILLALGGIIFIASLVLSGSLWSTAACGRYEVVEGVCTSDTAPALHRYRKVQLVDAQGAETTLLLSKASRFRIGSHYRFYFQTEMTTWTQPFLPIVFWGMKSLKRLPLRMKTLNKNPRNKEKAAVPFKPLWCRSFCLPFQI